MVLVMVFGAGVAIQLEVVRFDSGKIGSVTFSEDVRNSRWVFAWCANNRNTFRHHHLVSAMSMQIATAHKAGLAWMCVDPT